MDSVCSTDSVLNLMRETALRCRKLDKELTEFLKISRIYISCLQLVGARESNIVDEDRRLVAIFGFVINFIKVYYKVHKE